MSGGRGRGGGSTSMVSKVASALGIARYDMRNYCQPARTEPPPLFPPLSHSVPALPESDRRDYIVASKRVIIDRFRQSPFYLEEAVDDVDIKRYTDTYRQHGRPKLEPVWSRLPEELCWQKKGAERSTAKRRKDAVSELVNAKLAGLREVGEDEEKAVEAEDASDVEDEEGQEKEGDEPVSEDDLEEDNDYAQDYFDNGEGYGGGSDDDLDVDGDV
ncbi:unnamed protein product, partial [Mesorhabditis spiculigera]